jgi:hypothetical protein
MAKEKEGIRGLVYVEDSRGKVFCLKVTAAIETILGRGIEIVSLDCQRPTYNYQMWTCFIYHK